MRQVVKAQVSGTAAMLMHNVRMANPMDPIVQEIRKITSKPARQKTEADYEEIARLEFIGGMYHDSEIGPYIPSRVIRATIISGGTMTRAGEKVKRAVLVNPARAKLVYEGVRDLSKMQQSGHYADYRPVGGQGRGSGTKTMRCRPLFEPPWSVSFTLSVDTGMLSIDDVRLCLDNGGAYYGFCDGRSEGYGRFEIVEWDV